MTTAIADTPNRVSGTRRAAVPARLCAAVALASVAAHGWMAWEHRSMLWEAALMLLMASLCLPCAVAVWRGAHDRAVRVLFAMALAMVAVHTALLVGPGSMGAAHQHGGMGSMSAPGLRVADPLAGAMLWVVALELGVAMLAAWAMRRSRECAA
ncbi:MAG: hypothetical protein WBX27_09695 [Specibacter sp.]